MAARLVDFEPIENGIIYGVVAADAKADVTNKLKFGDNVMGLGSIAYTLNLEIAVCDSAGAWHWQQ